MKPPELPTEIIQAEEANLYRAIARYVSCASHQAHRLEECVKESNWMEQEDETKDALISDLEAQLAEAQHRAQVAEGLLAKLKAEGDVDV